MLCLACGAQMRLVEVVEDTTMLVSGYEHQTWQCSGCSSVEQRMTFTRKKGQTRRAPVEAAPTAATNASPKPFDEKLRDLMERATALKQAVAESKRRAQFSAKNGRAEWAYVSYRRQRTWPCIGSRQRKCATTAINAENARVDRSRAVGASF